MQLEEKKEVIIEYSSTGKKRRLVLARALINEPKIPILDEPTTGLEPHARHLLWNKIHSLQRKGSTIIMTTHYMDEAEQHRDRLINIDHCKTIEEGKPSDLIKKHV